MSAAMLLAPGDVIKRSSEELKQRQIQISLVDWTESESEKKEEPKVEREIKEQNNLNDGEGTQQKDGKKKEGGEEAQDADVDRRLRTAVGSGSSAKGSGERTDKDVDGGDGKTRRGGGDVDEGAGVAGASRGGWVVLTDEIARAIESKYGTKVDVYRDEASAQIIEIERSLQKELGITREGVAEQTEKLRDLRRKEKGEPRTKAVMKEDRKHGKNNRDSSSKKEGIGEEVQEKTTKVGITIEGVMSQKKLLSMIGGVERKAAPIGARESAVMLVSNNIKDVARATAYFTSPTGDPNWKEVAREASKKKNILAYSSTGGDTKTEFLHLIDHL
ncbi:VP6 [Bluetongue virus 1]|uniref:VP6 n=3 Tax=Bluetongue virus TaxID=40051 RepID=A0A0H4M3Z4_BTV1|nr:unknown [Bluetongue virus]AKP24117.1 VP6 [Bluetongue virus 1]AKP24127.1 VP6 [Bluetongue virus 1]AKP24156.1 VP6 [Bluetongue virus 1]